MNKDKQLHNDKINLSQLVLLGLGSLIGSGWLFGAWEASSIAGPAAIISWVLGFLVIGTIAYNYIEIGTMFPQSGGMSNYAQYTHGSLLGFIAAWANWVSLVTIIPIEAVSAVQYMSSWPWHWAKPMKHLMENGSISTYGLLAVYLIIVIFSLLNYWSVKLLTSFTSLISVFKLGVPMLTIIMLMLSGFDTSNYGHSASTLCLTEVHQFLLQQQHQGLFFHSIHSRQLLIWVQKLKILKKISQEASLSHCQSMQCCTSFYKVRLSLLCLNQCYNIVDGMASTSIHHLLI